MTLRDRLLALIAKLKTMGPSVLMLLSFIEGLLALAPQAHAKAAEQCCNAADCCHAVQVALLEALVKNIECTECCAE